MTRKEEIAYVRDLARQYLELADSDENRSRRKRWNDVYALRKPDRPPVIALDCRFVHADLAELKCSDPLCREIESGFRNRQVRWEMGDDFVFYPYLNTWTFMYSVLFNLGVAVECHAPDGLGTGSKNLYGDPPIKNEEDLSRIRVVEPTATAREAMEKMDKQVLPMEEILNSAIPVKRTLSYSPYMCIAAQLMGMEQLMLNMTDRPEFVHALMRIVQECDLHIMDAIEQAGALSEESNAHHNYPNPFAENEKATPSDVPWQFSDIWGRCESQEFNLVGPDMTDEFLLQYQVPIMHRFRHVTYGCCENLSRKLDHIIRLPNLRAIVNSPWTDLRKTANKCQDRFAILWRQPPWEVMFAKTDAELRANLERGMQITRGCYRGVFCMDNNWDLVKDAEERCRKWIDEAKRAAEKYAD